MKCEYVFSALNLQRKFPTCLSYPSNMRNLCWKTVCLQFSVILFLLSCKSDSLPANKDAKQLYQSFHGKYEIISSNASEPIDVNLDGVSSTNLLTELADIPNCHVEIRIQGIFLFDQFWPEPYFSGIAGTGESMPASYDPRITVNYAMQGVGRQFEFDEKVEQILLLPDHPSVNQNRFPRPSSIKLLPGEMVEVTINKTFYTTAGIKNVQVVTLYKRYTMVT